jgi:polyisoprenoid-binding protein YceI
VNFTRHGLGIVLLGVLAGVAATSTACAAAVAWRMDLRNSQLTFTPRLAGGEFEGRFERFETTVRFDPADLAHSSLQVIVDLSSARTGDSDRDTALHGVDFFAISRWPQARFASTRIRALGGNRYEATGKLTLRDSTHDVSVPFRFDLAAPAGRTARLSGATTLKRLQFGVGQGEWRSTEWLDDAVRVEFSVALEAVR